MRKILSDSRVTLTMNFRNGNPFDTNSTNESNIIGLMKGNNTFELFLMVTFRESEISEI